MALNFQRTFRFLSVPFWHFFRVRCYLMRQGQTLFLSFVLKQTKCFLGAQKIRKLLSNRWKSHLKRNFTKVQEKISKPVLISKAEVEGGGKVPA